MNTREKNLVNSGEIKMVRSIENKVKFVYIPRMLFIEIIG